MEVIDLADNPTAVAEPEVAPQLDKLVPVSAEVTPGEEPEEELEEEPETVFDKMLAEERFKPVWESRQAKLQEEERQKASAYWQGEFEPALKEVRGLGEARNQHWEEARKGIAALRSQLGRLRADGEVSDRTLVELLEAHPEWQAAIKWVDDDMSKEATQRGVRQGQDIGVAATLQHFFSHAEPTVRDKYVFQIQTSNPAQLADAFVDEFTKAAHERGYNEGYKKGLKDSKQAGAETGKAEARQKGPGFSPAGATGTKGSYKERLSRGETLSSQEIDAMTRELVP